MSSVYTNVQANSIYNTYSINNRQGNHFMQRLASGLKIMTPKDNASVYAISERMRSQIRANEQANQNAQNDSALLKTAQGGISNTVDILKTLKERAINAANDSNLNQNRSDIATEVQQLGLQVDDNAYKVKYNNRAVLNGGFDSTVGRLNGVSAVEEKTTATVSDNPTAKSTHAVYNATNFTVYNTTSKLTEAADSATNLTALTKSNATSAGDTLLHVGDKITFSWKENGNIVSKEWTVSDTYTSGSTVKTLANLATELNGASANLKVEWKTEATDGTDTFTSNDTTTTEDTLNDNVVLNSTTYEKLTARESGGTGMYAVAKKDVAITDFSVEVTYVNAKGETVNRTDAQEALKLNGVQQTHNQQKGSSDIGSHSVFSNNLYEGETNKGIAGAKGDNTAFNELIVRGTPATKALADDNAFLDITVNDRTYRVSTSATIDDLNKMLEDDKMGVQVHLLNKGDTLKYGDTAVTRGVGDDAAEFKATASGLYFVGADGVDIQEVKMKALKDDGNTTGSNFAASSFATTATGLTGAAAATGAFHSIQVRGDVPETTEKNSSNPLTFFIGGEPNFGIEVTINKMDMKSLIGMDSDSFAKKFLTKEGAESALTMIDDAISKALNEQTKLGAIESRLGYASDNLTTMNTNMEETDSVLRDADIAKDMVQFSKYSVLSQFAQAMLAQANNSGAGMLQFLQP